jgi:uncharacterized protein (DUF1330 family)
MDGGPRARRSHVTIPVRAAFRARLPSTTESFMPKGYWVTIYRRISDPKKLAAYAELAPKATAPFGGKYLARGTAANAYEAGLKDRIVITEFPSVEKANAAYNSPGYKDALKALSDGAERDVRIVEGLE